MEEHDNVVRNLNEEFRKVDRAYKNSEMRVFGKNTGRIFRELDVIRRKQIDLASDHVSLETITDIPPVPHLSKSTSKTSQEHSTSQSFDKKEATLKNMMEKLDDLTESMDRFKKISEHNYVGDDTLVTSDNSNGSSKDDLRLQVPVEHSQLHKPVSNASTHH